MRDEKNDEAEKMWKWRADGKWNGIYVHLHDFVWTLTKGANQKNRLFADFDVCA